MISRKWLYSYRMLTARLHEGMPAPTNQMAGFTVGSHSRATPADFGSMMS